MGQHRHRGDSHPSLRLGHGGLLGVGLISLVVDSPRYNPWLGVAYGIGTALAVDEFASLLNLRDVYWSTEGRVSVDVALTTIAIATIYFAAKSFCGASGVSYSGQDRPANRVQTRRYILV